MLDCKIADDKMTNTLFDGHWIVLRLSRVKIFIYSTLYTNAMIISAKQRTAKHASPIINSDTIREVAIKMSQTTGVYLIQAVRWSISTISHTKVTKVINRCICFKPLFFASKHQCVCVLAFFSRMNITVYFDCSRSELFFFRLSFWLLLLLCFCWIGSSVRLFVEFVHKVIKRVPAWHRHDCRMCKLDERK